MSTTKLLPAEPSDEMLVAGARCRTSPDRNFDQDDTLRPEYKAMYEAAPDVRIPRLITPEDIIEMKTGDREFILTWDTTGWLAAIGNNIGHVALGEAISYESRYADFLVDGHSSSQAALNALYEKVIQHPVD